MILPRQHTAKGQGSQSTSAKMAWISATVRLTAASSAGSHVFHQPVLSGPQCGDREAAPGELQRTGHAEIVIPVSGGFGAGAVEHHQFGVRTQQPDNAVDTPQIASGWAKERKELATSR